MNTKDEVNKTKQFIDAEEKPSGQKRTPLKKKPLCEPSPLNGNVNIDGRLIRLYQSPGTCTTLAVIANDIVTYLKKPADVSYENRRSFYEQGDKAKHFHLWQKLYLIAERGLKYNEKEAVIFADNLFLYALLRIQQTASEQNSIDHNFLGKGDYVNSRALSLCEIVQLVYKCNTPINAGSPSEQDLGSLTKAFQLTEGLRILNEVYSCKVINFPNFLPILSLLAYVGSILNFNEIGKVAHLLGKLVSERRKLQNLCEGDATDILSNPDILDGFSHIYTKESKKQPHLRQSEKAYADYVDEKVTNWQREEIKLINKELDALEEKVTSASQLGSYQKKDFQEALMKLEKTTSQAKKNLSQENFLAISKKCSKIKEIVDGIVANWQRQEVERFNKELGALEEKIENVSQPGLHQMEEFQADLVKFEETISQEKENLPPENFRSFGKRCSKIKGIMEFKRLKDELTLDRKGLHHIEEALNKFELKEFRKLGATGEKIFKDLLQEKKKEIEAELYEKDPVFRAQQVSKFLIDKFAQSEAGCLYEIMKALSDIDSIASQYKLVPEGIDILKSMLETKKREIERSLRPQTEWMKLIIEDIKGFNDDWDKKINYFAEKRKEIIQKTLGAASYYLLDLEKISELFNQIANDNEEREAYLFTLCGSEQEKWDYLLKAANSGQEHRAYFVFKHILCLPDDGIITFINENKNMRHILSMFHLQGDSLENYLSNLQKIIDQKKQAPKPEEPQQFYTENECLKQIEGLSIEFLGDRSIANQETRFNTLLTEIERKYNELISAPGEWKAKLTTAISMKKETINQRASEQRKQAQGIIGRYIADIEAPLEFKNIRTIDDIKQKKNKLLKSLDETIEISNALNALNKTQSLEIETARSKIPDKKKGIELATADALLKSIQPRVIFVVDESIANKEKDFLKKSKELEQNINNELDMLRTLSSDDKSKWKDKIKSAISQRNNAFLLYSTQAKEKAKSIIENYVTDIENVFTTVENISTLLDLDKERSELLDKLKQIWDSAIKDKNLSNALLQLDAPALNQDLNKIKEAYFKNKEKIELAANKQQTKLQSKEQVVDNIIPNKEKEEQRKIKEHQEKKQGEAIKGYQNRFEKLLTALRSKTNELIDKGDIQGPNYNARYQEVAVIADTLIKSLNEAGATFFNSHSIIESYQPFKTAITKAINDAEKEFSKHRAPFIIRALSVISEILFKILKLVTIVPFAVDIFTEEKGAAQGIYNFFTKLKEPDAAKKLHSFESGTEKLLTDIDQNKDFLRP